MPVVMQQQQQPVSMANVTPSSVSMPVSMSAAVPSSVSMAVPSSISMAVPSSVSIAVPSSVPMAVPNSVSMAIPSSIAMATPSSVSMAMPMSSADAMYIMSSAAPTSTSMSRHVSIVQPPTTFLAASSPQVLPTSSLSTVNSIPPTRDPITSGLTPGGSNLTPTVAVREASYVAPFKDSQPIVSDLLVERLEEISTQREMAEDPER